MSDQENPSVNERRHRRERRSGHGFLSGLVLGGIAGAMLTVTISSFAHFGGPRSAGLDSIDPERAMARAEIAIDMLLGRVDATEAQRNEVTTIVQNLIADLQPILTEHGGTHEAVREILAQPFVDRAALEALRASAIQQADATSTRVVDALADAAEVLTPEQRVELIELGRQMRDH